MKAAILTLALAIFMLGASATYVMAIGSFSCTGTITYGPSAEVEGGHPLTARLRVSCG